MRKKGLGGVRIEHNKPLLIVIIVLLIVLAGLIFAIVNIGDMQSSGNFCNSGSDCYKIQTTCCPCSSGGMEICGTLADLHYWQDKLLSECSKGSICAQVYNCKPNICKCSDGKCS